MKNYKKARSFTPTPMYRWWGFICLTAALIWPRLALAANPALGELDDVATGQAGPYKLGGATVYEIVGTAVNIALSLLGIIFLLLMIFAGYNWMTAQGDEEKVTKAKAIIVRAVIGIIIVVGSYAAWRFLFVKLLF